MQRGELRKGLNREWAKQTFTVGIRPLETLLSMADTCKMVINFIVILQLAFLIS